MDSTPPPSGNNITPTLTIPSSQSQSTMPFRHQNHAPLVMMIQLNEEYGANSVQTGTVSEIVLKFHYQQHEKQQQYPQQLHHHKELYEPVEISSLKSLSIHSSSSTTSQLQNNHHKLRLL